MRTMSCSLVSVDDGHCMHGRELDLLGANDCKRVLQNVWCTPATACTAERLC